MSLHDAFGEPRATWWAQAAPATTYWRCEVPARRLRGQVFQLKTSDLQRDGKGFVFPRQCGAAIWQFPGNTTRALLMAGMQQAGVPVFVEVDDNYLGDFPMPQISQWRSRLDRNNLDQVTREVHAKIIPWVDGVIVSTPALYRAYGGRNSNTVVCPNSIEPDDWPEPEKPDDGVLRIGYAASQSHMFDIRLIEQAFDWASRQKDVEIVLFGLRPRQGYWARIPLRHEGWVEDLAVYRKSLEILDVGVCPLKPTHWSNCKSDLKAMEYAMAGALPIVQKTEPYAPWLDQSCLIADKPKDWLKHLKWCVANRDEVKQLAREAKDYVLHERTIAGNVWRWEEALCAAPALA